MNAIYAVMSVSQYHDMTGRDLTAGQLVESFVQLGALVAVMVLVIWVCVRVLF
jgi:hypothetical protein